MEGEEGVEDPAVGGGRHAGRLAEPNDRAVEGFDLQWTAALRQAGTEIGVS
jgi:hypothetical protein